MSSLPIIVTDRGRVALVNAANTGTAPVTIASVGVSATAITPSTATTALPNEIKRIVTISGDVVADDTIHLIVRDDSDGVYSVRSFALYLNDGTLFASYGQPGVILEKSALALLLLAIDVRFADVAATSLTFGNANFLNPPATTEAQGVVELATAAEAAAGTDALRAITPATAKASVIPWLGFTPMDRAGGTFGGAFGRDADFYLNIQGGNPLINFSPFAYLSFARAARTFSFIVDGYNSLVISATSVTIAGQTVWHTGNDGAGSGLDADLLDGQQGAYYANVPARLGYTPANKAGEVFSGAIAATSVEVSSGDLLLSRTTSAWGYITRPNVAGYRNLGFCAVGAAVLDQVYISAYSVTINGNAVWHAGNDGAGSGLDADLLDGQDSGYFTNIPARLGYTPISAAGGLFTGAVGFGDNSFRMAISGGNPVLSVDGDSYTAFLRASKQYEWAIAGARAFAANTSGMYVDKLLNVSGALTRAGNTVWDAGNDGAGSGLDADLLDGQDSGYFTNIPARLGYTPISAAGGLFTGAVGFGDNNFRMAISGGNALMSVDGDSYIAFLRTSKQYEWAIAGARTFAVNASGMYVDKALNVSGGLTRAGNIVWDAGNDGAGSGLDADLLDGQDSSFFTNIPARLGYTPANAAGQIFGGDIGPEAGFRMVFSEGNPGIFFTADGKSSVFFNRSRKMYTFYMDGRGVFDVDVNGNARFRGTVTQNVAL